MDLPSLLDGLDSVISIPLIPYKEDGCIDFDGHATNIDYLIEGSANILQVLLSQQGK